MKPRVPLPDELTSRPFTVADAKRRGLGPRRLDGRDLARPFHGVRMPITPTTVEELCRAYLLRMPHGGFFFGSTAARLWGLPLPRPFSVGEELHVAVPAPARAPRARGVVGHKVQVAEGDVVARDGVPVTSALRTWCSLATELTAEELVVAGAALIDGHAPLATIGEIASQVTALAGIRGHRTLATACARLTRPSAFESRAARDFGDSSGR